MLTALTMSLAFGVAFIVIDKPPPAEVGELGNQAPLTDEQSRDQVVSSAREIVAAAQLEAVTGSYTFLSCANEHDPPYQAALYLNFALSEPNSVERVRQIADALVADGWTEATSMGESFGRKLTRDGVTTTFQRNVDKADFGTMRIYGECRNMADHRNDNPAWTDIGQLS